MHSDLNHFQTKKWRKPLKISGHMVADFSEVIDFE